MLAHAAADQPQPLRRARAVAAARRRAADLEAALLLGLLLLVGLVWMVIGAAVMRGARDAGAPAEPSLQGGLADLQAVAAD